MNLKFLEDFSGIDEKELEKFYFLKNWNQSRFLQAALVKTEYFSKALAS